MSPLELRYRRLLRLLPAAYRAAREEEMVDTFLLSMQQEEAEDDEIAQLTAHPSWSERLSVVGLTLHLRWGGGHQAPVRYQTQRGAVRWFVAAVLLIQAVLAVLSLLVQVWTVHNAPEIVTRGRASFGNESFLSWVLATAGLLWIPAFVALMRGHRRAVHMLVALATAPLAVEAVTDAVRLIVTPTWVEGVASSWVLLMIDASVLVGLAAFHRETPPLRPGPWLISAGVGLAALGASPLVPGLSAWVLVDDVSLWSVATVVGAFAVAVMGQRWDERRRAQSHLGVCLLATATFVLRAATVATLSIPNGLGFLPASARVGLVVQLVAVAWIAGGFGWVGSRRLRRMPSVTYAPA